MVLLTTQLSPVTTLTNANKIPGLTSLWTHTLGDPSICIAVLDGPVDQDHPCFEGANLTRLPTLVTEAASSGTMSGHGTHITSLIWGQHNSSMPGIAPNCRGLILPIFSDNHQRRLSQMDLARAINQAVEHGAHIINISGGELANSGEADPILANAICNCNDNGVLIVAAAGNNGCDCLHVPAALPAVLAVGAMDARGLPLESSNWGETYQTQGILAPGQDIVGAMPGARVASLSGTSFATPIVTGIAALLLCLHKQREKGGNAHDVRAALLNSALPCRPETGADCRRYLAGILNVPGAYALISNGVETMSDTPAQHSEPTNGDAILPNAEAMTTPPSVQSSAAVASEIQPAAAVTSMSSEASPGEAISLAGMAPSALPLYYPVPSQIVPAYGVSGSLAPSHLSTPYVTPTTPSEVQPSGNCNCPPSVAAAASVLPSNTAFSKVYALGELGYDFGTEARRDTFKQLMPSFRAEDSDTEVPPNPYDARQMVSYLSTEGNLSEAQSLIWTLNLELTPIYAVEPIGEFARDIYELLVGFLAGQVLDDDSAGFIQRISIPGHLSSRSVRLFSGQMVPVIEMRNIRGMYGWRINQLIQAAVDQAQGTADENSEVDEEKLRESLKFFLNRIYYDFRNLGDTSQDRALNFAATNAFQATQVFVDALKSEEGGGSYQLSNISVERSPFCRVDSDCWDVKLVFFNPINDRAAKKVFRFTIDVSDVIPVTMGEVRTWKEAS